MKITALNHRQRLATNTVGFTVDAVEFKTALTGLSSLMDDKTATHNHPKRSAQLTIVNTGGELHLFATDLATFAVATMQSHALLKGGDGTCTVGLKQIKAAVNGKGSLAIHIRPKQNQLTLMRGQARVQMVLEKDDGMCWPSNFKPSAAKSLRANDLASALQRALTCADPIETRANLAGVHFKVADDGLRIASTDGHKLYVHHWDKATGQAGSLHAPHHVMATLAKKKMLAGLGTQVRLRFSWAEEGQLATAFKNAGVAWKIQTQSNKAAAFPDLAKVVPSHTSAVGFKTDALRVKVSEVLAFHAGLGVSKKIIRPLALDFHFAFSHKKVGLLGFDDSTKSTFASEVAIQSAVALKPLTLGFNADYIHSILRVCPADITMHLGRALQPVIFCPSAAHSLGQSPWYFVLMPLRIDWTVDFKPSALVEPPQKPQPKPLPRRVKKTASQPQAQPPTQPPTQLRRALFQIQRLDLTGMAARWA